MLKPVERLAAPSWRALRRLKNRALNLADPPLVILCYHRVARLDLDPHGIAVAPENFRAQMLYLRDHCRCRRLDEERPAGRRAAVAVTFDDGYADNLHQALPILAEAGIPATFFISTGQIGGGGFWSDELARLLLGPGPLPEEFTLDDRDCGGSWPSIEPEQRKALHDRLHRAMLGVDAPRREAWLAQLRDWAGAPGPTAADRALTADEVRQLASHPLVTIGAHGVTHTPLALLDEERQAAEIRGSLAALGELLQRPVELFAYPFGGRRQYDAVTIRQCRSAGVRRAVTTLPGQVHRWSDPWQLPRQLVRNWDGAEFARQMRSFWH